MRSLPLLLFASALAGPAAAQVDPAVQMRETELMAQQDLARQRDIALRNDLTALETRLETDQRLRSLEPHNLDTRPPPPYLPTHPADAYRGAWPQIPDTALAASRARVLAASRNRR